MVVPLFNLSLRNAPRDDRLLLPSPATTKGSYRLRPSNSFAIDAIAMNSLICAKRFLRVVLSFALISCGETQSQHLTCTGSVEFGDQKFPDELAIELSSQGVQVKGGAYETSTFEAGIPYTVCFEDQNEVDFEYTTLDRCGKEATRFGYLQKALGSLRLTRSDRGSLFVGKYKCDK